MGAAPTENMLSNMSRLTKVCREPVSRSATQPKGARTLPPLFTAIFVVNEASSSVMMPPTRQVPCSDSARQGRHQVVQLKPRGCCLPARHKTRSNTLMEDLGKHRPEP